MRLWPFLFAITPLTLPLAARHSPLQRTAVPETIWLEAETFGPLKGANFSFMQTDKTTKGSWSVAGPDTAASWTQGGESEWMSIAARADEPNELVVSRDIEVPVDGDYFLWVRYADYRNKEEKFGVRVKQAGGIIERVFGERPVIDELDPMKLLWDWSFGWDRASVPLRKGPARVEIYTTGPTEARRCVDCLCFTTDTRYHPAGREKPDHPTWELLRTMSDDRRSLTGDGGRVTDDSSRQLAVGSRQSLTGNPKSKIQNPQSSLTRPPSPVKAPAFLWNVGQPWVDELKKPEVDRVDAPFAVDPPLQKDFLAAFKGTLPPVFGSRLSGPVWHIPLYPQMFAPGSPFLDWLARHPDQRFAILLNYGDPTWQPGKDQPADRAAIRAALQQFGDRFVGFVAGENVAYANVDTKELEDAVRKAKSRGEVLAALKELNTAATRAKFAGYYGTEVSAEEAWGPVISCLSANMEAWCHALCSLGVKQIGHENTGNSPTLSRRLAFLRGACRQFGTSLVNYQSCNLGDAATIFSREHYFYPASSRYILDNSYDAFAGAGVNWLWKDYFLWHLAGVNAFYHEQGVDIFWKPGGGSAGDDFPVQLSPKGKVAEAVIKLAEDHPRGTQYTPIAFLLDEAHGWSQERFETGSFGLDPTLNPAVLTPGAHEASLRGWFDVAYFPAPETQNEPATGVRQTYVNGIFGDIFDVIVTAPKATKALSRYPVIICAGEIHLTEEWGRALAEYMKVGGRLVVCDAQFSGPGVAKLGLPVFGAVGEAEGFGWQNIGRPIVSNRFRYRGIKKGTPLATAPDGSVIAVTAPVGKGSLTVIGVPLGLGIDLRPVPLLGLIMKELVDSVTPIRVHGDVEWTLNRLDDGGWLIGLLNNRGVLKPQHGIYPTDAREAQAVEIALPFVPTANEEWIAKQKVMWTPNAAGAASTLVIPAGATRLVYVRP